MKNLLHKRTDIEANTFVLIYLCIYIYVNVLYIYICLSGGIYRHYRIKESRATHQSQRDKFELIKPLTNAKLS